VEPDSFRACLSNPDSSRTPHPALINAMLLIASSHYSQLIHVTEYSNDFLSQALEDIAAGVAHTDRLLDVIQASCLLATYFYVHNRVQEGYYHSTSAASLALTLEGLPVQEQLTASYVQAKATTMCQVFVVDRGWAVATDLPSILPDHKLEIAPTLASRINSANSCISVRRIESSILFNQQSNLFSL
jgi:Fungal specific transcription factor domain